MYGDYSIEMLEQLGDSFESFYASLEGENPVTPERMEKTLLSQLTDVPSKFMQRWMVFLPDQDHQWDYRIDVISDLSDDISRMGERCLSMIQETPERDLS